MGTSSQVGRYGGCIERFLKRKKPLGNALEEKFRSQGMMNSGSAIWDSKMGVRREHGRLCLNKYSSV